MDARYENRRVGFLIEESYLLRQEQEILSYFCFHCHEWIMLHWPND